MSFVDRTPTDRAPGATWLSTPTVARVAASGAPRFHAAATRHTRTFVIAALLSFIIASAGTVAEAQRTPRPAMEPRSAVLWQPVELWTFSFDGYEGNPFDVEATATFSHDDERRITSLFYVGGGTWALRFTGTRTGAWTFETESEHDALDGWRGRVDVAPNPDAEATGFLTTAGQRFAAPVDDEGTLVARLYNVYLHHALKNSLADYSTRPHVLEADIDEVLDEVELHGFDAAFVAVGNNWFSFGASNYRDHDSEDPSLISFHVLETLIQRAHGRGLSVHIWAWGDEERRDTPIGVGGINGQADRRLQRYIAARLGPLPGWTMSYGFDLEEWVAPEQTRAWRDYLNAHLGWPHQLMARESRLDMREAFRLGDEKLDVFSTDERPHQDFYAAALAALASSDVPVIFERRFLHTRDDVWDMDTTRRALWQFTLAGGVGAIWGVLWFDGPPYPAAHQLHTHGTFWRGRWSLDLLRPDDDGVGVYELLSEARDRAVVYAEATDVVRLDLGRLEGPQPAVAVDARAPYQELDLGVLEAVDQTWTAPYPSDWAVAVGTF